jgi:magnesium-transporting ATPase (P-type)
MSVIAKRPDGKVFIYVKGADSSLLRMSDGQGAEDLKEEIERMAAKGYRTLVFGVKEIK